MPTKKYVLPLLLLVQIIILQILSLFPEAIEKYYSNGLFVGISNVLRVVFGWIPFAVGDFIYFIVIAMVLRWFWRRRKSWRFEWKDNVLKMLSVLSVVYFLFHILWATNYHRVKLADKLEIGTEYSDADLLAFTKRIIQKTNEVHLQIVKYDSIKVDFPYTQQQVFDKNLFGYKILEQQYPFFAYKNPSIKKSVISLPLTYMGFAGYLNPFTHEANVNYMLPMYSFPTTATHEMAHQIGYGSESEANFIGYLAVINNDDLYFKYAGYSLALRYCLRNWEYRDEKVLEELLPTVNTGILKNFEDSTTFWEQYESFVETGFKIFYDNFLKFNQQEDGIESYSRFVDLLVNYYRKEQL